MVRGSTVTASVISLVVSIGRSKSPTAPWVLRDCTATSVSVAPVPLRLTLELGFTGSLLETIRLAVRTPCPLGLKKMSIVHAAAGRRGVVLLQVLEKPKSVEPVVEIIMNKFALPVLAFSNVV